MKKLIQLFALVLCFSFLAATVANAQNIVRNNTACAFTVTVEYGDVSGGNCNIVGTVTITAPAMSNTWIPILDFYSPIVAYGNYFGVGLDACAFYVEHPCNGTQQINNVTCPLACGNYSATYVTGLGNIVLQ